MYKEMSRFSIISLYLNILGDHKCHSTLVSDAVAKLSLLTYGRYHPMCQRFLYHRYVGSILMPQESQEVLENFKSSSPTMALVKCQGGDAFLKEINKERKS